MWVMNRTPHPPTFRFGSFELNIGARLLQRNGLRIRLAEKPFRLLATLVSRAGETVTRDELRAALWPSNLHLNFEHGLDNAINKVRTALGDNAENPRFIATVPKIGYRFIASVEVESSPHPTEKPAIGKAFGIHGSLGLPLNRSRRMFLSFLASVLAGVLVFTGQSMLRQYNVSSEIRRLQSRKAGEAYALGVYFQSLVGEQAVFKSREYLRQAINLDPMFADAYAKLALTEQFIGDEYSPTPTSDYQNATVHARRALDLDGSLADAHVALGNVKLRGDWDWGAARQEYQTALKLNPNSAVAYAAYAEYLSATAQKGESLTAIARAHALNPFSTRIRYQQALLSYFARDYEQTIDQLTSLVHELPTYPDARKSLSDVYARVGKWERAAQELVAWLKLIQVDEDEIRSAQDILRRQGFRAFWRRHSRSEDCPRSPDDYGMPFNRAVYSALVDDTEPAIMWLHVAYRQHDNRLLDLKVDPEFDALRSDPRFGAVLKSLGL
jgi:DNA-binding winged helix-turn-helix (wHTH) protein/tetratricopeptide (TPR) repeat protein